MHDTDVLLNHHKLRMKSVFSTSGEPRVGIVESYDPNGPTVRLTVQPNGVLTGWLPLMGLSVGSGWGIICPPAIGSQAVYICQEGSSQDGIVIGGIWSSVNVPPSAQAGEFWLVHESGSLLKLTNDGGVTLTAENGLTINGDVTINGTVMASNDVVAGSISLQNHVHGGVTSGTSDTTGPTG